MIHKKLSALLAEEGNVVFGYLFGSYARGDATPGSDVDLALFLRDTSLDARLALHHRLQKALKKEIDMVVLNEARNLYLLEHILREGILLKDAPLRAEYEVDTHHRILDFKAFKRYIDAA